MNIYSRADSISKNPDIIETSIDGVFLILDPVKHAYYTLNEVGVHIWHFLQSHPVTFESICDYLQEKYRLERDESERHAYVFIESMVAKKILTHHLTLS